MRRSFEDLESDVRKLTARVEALERATGQGDQTCGGIHPPFDEIQWPSHCHTAHCPRCGREYPV